MPKILVEFDSIEQAQAAVNAVYGHSPAPAAPAPAYNPPPPPAAPYVPPAPPQAPPVQHAAPPQGYAPAPQAAPAPAPAPAPQAPPVGASGITLAQLVTAAQNYAKVHTPKGAKAKLAEFGITELSKADPAVYPQLLAALSA